MSFWELLSIFRKIRPFLNNQLESRNYAKSTVFIVSIDHLILLQDHLHKPSNAQQDPASSWSELYDSQTLRVNSAGPPPSGDPNVAQQGDDPGKASYAMRG